MTQLLVSLTYKDQPHQPTFLASQPTKVPTLFLAPCTTSRAFFGSPGRISVTSAVTDSGKLVTNVV